MLKVRCGNVTIQALIDTGCITSVIQKEVLQQITSEGVDVPSLPLTKSFLIGANKKKSRPITQQVFLEVEIGSKWYEVVSLVAHELLFPFILGMDFLQQHLVTIDLEQHVIKFSQNESIPITYNSANQMQINCNVVMAGTNILQHVLLNNSLLNEMQQRQLSTLLEKYSKVFEKPEQPVKNFSSEIEVTGETSFTTNQYCNLNIYEKEINQLILTMLNEENIIKEENIMKEEISMEVNKSLANIISINHILNIKENYCIH